MGTLKFIYALMNEIVPSNVPTVANASPVSTTEEISSGDTIRKCKLDIQS